MTYSYTIFNSYKELDASWDNFFEPHHNFHSSQISVTEKSAIKNMLFFYVQIKNENNEIVMLAYFQQIKILSDNFNLSEGSVLIKKGLSALIDFLKPKLLVAGNLFRHDTPIFYTTNKNFTPENEIAIYENCVDFLIHHSKSKGVFIKDLEEKYSTEIKKNDGYQELKNDIAMYLPLEKEWQNFEDYSNELKHKYKQRAKKVRKSFADVIIKPLQLEDLKKYEKDIFRLYHLVVEKQVVSMGELSPTYIYELKKSLQEKYLVMGFFEGERLIAFSSAIIHEGVHDMNYIGFEYELNQKYQLYFNILFHCIECAISHKMQILFLGRTALEAKAIIGCKPKQLYTFYKLKNSVLHFITKKLSAMFNNKIGETWENRHPFNTSYYEKIEQKNI
ncbi:MAG: hypothetical protein KA275_00240 [Chitinophagaceae bacterium]|nr:hypothetical protein [Chitinophagaceae bacterium]